MRYLLTTLAAVLALGLVAAADKPAVTPPYQRLLQGDDATLAADLEKRFGQSAETDRYPEAMQAAGDRLRCAAALSGGPIRGTTLWEGLPELSASRP